MPLAGNLRRVALGPPLGIEASLEVRQQRRRHHRLHPEARPRQRATIGVAVVSCGPVAGLRWRGLRCRGVSAQPSATMGRGSEWLESGGVGRNVCIAHVHAYAWASRGGFAEGRPGRRAGRDDSRLLGQHVFNTVGAGRQRCVELPAFGCTLNSSAINCQNACSWVRSELSRR